MRGLAVVAEAREWLGTPFKWQASLKGAGCDCKGLLWGVARELGYPEAESLYAQAADYGSRFDGNRLKEGIAALFDRVETMEPGDVLLCRYKGAPAHLAIYAGDGMAIHTQIKSKAWVKETALRVIFFSYPLDSIWRWRELN